MTERARNRRARLRRLKIPSTPSEGIERCPECKTLLDYQECYRRSTKNETTWTYWRCRVCGIRFRVPDNGGKADILTL